MIRRPAFAALLVLTVPPAEAQTTGSINPFSRAFAPIGLALDSESLNRHIASQNLPSWEWEGRVASGAVLPTGISLYAIPSEFRRETGHRFAVVNRRYVIVDSASRKIIDVIQ